MGIGLTVLTNLAQWTLVAAQLPGGVPDAPLSHDELRSVATAELADANVATQAPLSPASRLVDINLALVPSASELVRSADGLFYLDAKVNGVAVRFLVDTGATSVVLTDVDARRAGVAADLSGSVEQAQTAGGSTPMARVRLASLEAGPARRHDVEACVTASGLSVSLLGQSWLAQFDSVTITRDRMILR